MPGPAWFFFSFFFWPWQSILLQKSRRRSVLRCLLGWCCLEDQHLIGTALRAVLVVGALVLVIGCQRGGIIHHGLCGQMERKIKFCWASCGVESSAVMFCWWNVPRPAVININISINNINPKWILHSMLSADLPLICSGWVCIINESRDKAWQGKAVPKSNPCWPVFDYTLHGAACTLAHRAYAWFRHLLKLLCVCVRALCEIELKL